MASGQEKRDRMEEVRSRGLDEFRRGRAQRQGLAVSEGEGPKGKASTWTGEPRQELTGPQRGVVLGIGGMLGS